jgi:dolichol-phosphate mannosyltransferase
MALNSYSLGILCFNEAGNIGPTLQKAWEVMSSLSEDFEILVIDDGSSDGSQEEVRALLPQMPQARLIEHKQNKGIGEALHTFYGSASKDWVVYTPGDGQFDYNELRLVPQLEPGYFVSFYRIENTTYGLFRNILTLFNKQLNRICLGLTLKDVNWVKIYHRSDLQLLDLEVRSSLLESEISAKLFYLGRKIIEIESRYLPREHGQSKGASWNILKKVLKDTLKLIGIVGRFRRKSRKRNRRLQVES